MLGLSGYIYSQASPWGMECVTEELKYRENPTLWAWGAGVLSSLSLPLRREAVRGGGGGEKGLTLHKGPSWAGNMGQHAVVTPS